MTPTKKPRLICLPGCALLLLLLAGCATPTPSPAPPYRLMLPSQPVLVLRTTPRPPGYFQQALLNYFSGSLEKPTTSTTPTPAAAPMANP